MAKLTSLEKQHKTNPSSKINTELTQIRQEVRNHMILEHQLYLQKFKATHYTQGNKAGKFLAAYIRKKQQKSKLSYIIDPITSQAVYHPKDIANAFCKYYKQLYNLKEDPSTTQPTEKGINAFLNSINLPSLNNDQLMYLNSAITNKEITLAVQSLPHNKLPCADGFSAEYYNAFSNILVPYMNNLFQKASTDSTFPEEMLQAVIVTLPKPGKKPEAPQNFRPISLLNTDLKIYSKILANRLAEVTPSLIKADQVGFVKGRQAPDGTRRMFNLLKIAETRKVPTVFLTLDAEKAFDRVHWGYLLATLAKFGLSGPILSSISALYTVPTAQVYTSNAMSDKFHITNGTRQGCPLSPLIFSLVMEPLAETVRKDTLIKGIVVSDVDHRIGLFADDVVLTLISPNTSLDRTQQILTDFGKISYYKLNISKSSILPIHINKSNLKKLKSDFPFEWAHKYLKYLGINLSYPSATVYDHNYPSLLNTIKNDLGHISSHELSWIGRIATFKMTVLPKILYYFRTIPIILPDHFFITIDKILRKYIWAGKIARLSYSTLQKQKQKGGMGFPNIRNYYVAALLDQAKSWFTRTSDKLWVQIENAIVHHRDLPSLLLATLTNRPLFHPNFPSINATVNAWKIVNEKDDGSKTLQKREISLGMYEYLIPSLKLTKKDVLRNLSYTQFKAQFSSTPSYANIQLHHYHIKYPYSFLNYNPTVWTYISTSSDKPKGLTWFYKYLQNTHNQTKTTSMLNWERDLRSKFALTEWNKAIQANHLYSHCTNHWDISLKLLYRSYLTPMRISQIFHSSDIQCWRNCGNSGTIFHILWDCKSIRSFWNSTFSLLSKITGIVFTPTPALAILNLGIDKIPRNYRRLTTHILIAA